MHSFYEAIDPVFHSYVLGNAPVKKLTSDFDWVEGPVWFGDHECLLFSDIPNNRIMRWSAKSGVTTFREPSGFANGLTRDREGRLIACEHGTRRVTRTEYDGSITVIADHYEGKRLNSPNDVIVRSDGTIWFSDPHYGIMTNYEGSKAEQELACDVYRVYPLTGLIEVVASDFAGPNGLAFSPDEKRLYIGDTGAMFDRQAERHIRVFDVDAEGGLSSGDIFHRIEPGAADGFRVDSDGNVWSSAADGVHCISPSGELLGKVLVPELVSNVCFGGRHGSTLFITATTSVYSIALNREGARRPL